MSAGPSSLAVTLTVDELRAVVREALRDVARTPPPPEVLTRDQAAELLQVSSLTLMKYVRERGLPAHSLGPRDWRFRRSELLQWVASQKPRER